MPNFNLTEELWIPCRLLNNVTVEEKNLKQTLIEAPQIREIIGDTSLVTIALHRLLLAVLHRLFGPKNAAEWQRMWNDKKWNAGKLEQYFTEQRTQFELFDEERPFYQTPTLDFALGGSVAGLIMAGNNTLFVHVFDDEPPLLTPPEAARHLLALQSFDFGGTKTHEPNRKQDKYTNASPLIQCAVGLVRGENLFETLMLNMHRYDAEDAEPFEFEPQKDLPAWERNESTKPTDRRPDGYLDLLTWQSRRIRLQAEDINGEIKVSKVVIMKGYQFPDGFQLQGKETMVAFLKNHSAQQNERPWIPLGFEEDRAMWRDSLTIFQSMDDEQIRPHMMDWLGDLVAEDVLSRERLAPVDFHGLAADRGRLLFWRHERLLLPIAVLSDESLLKKIGDGLQLAEQIKDVLTGSARTLARLLLFPNSKDASTISREGKAKIRDFVRSLGIEAFYWARLEPHFKLLLTVLPNAEATKEEDEASEADEPLRVWAGTLESTARAAFDYAARSLDTSARNLKAAAAAEREFKRNLRATLGEFSERYSEAHRLGGVQ